MTGGDYDTAAAGQRLCVYVCVCERGKDRLPLELTCAFQLLDLQRSHAETRECEHLKAAGGHGARPGPEIRTRHVCCAFSTGILPPLRETGAE